MFTILGTGKKQDKIVCPHTGSIDKWTPYSSLSTIYYSNYTANPVKYCIAAFIKMFFGKYYNKYISK